MNVVSLPTPNICPFSLAAKFFRAVTASTCEYASPTPAVLSTQSHHLCVTSRPLTGSPFVDFKPAMGSLSFLRLWVFILPAFVWSCPSLCLSAEHDPLLMEKSPPFPFLPLHPDLSLWSDRFILLENSNTASILFSFNGFLALFQIHAKLNVNEVTWIILRLPSCQVCGHKMVTFRGWDR